MAKISRSAEKNNSASDSLGTLERSVMELLWASNEEVSSGYIRDNINEQSSKVLAMTTILTVLSRLEKKNFVTRNRKHRPHLYSSVLTREDYTAKLMHEALGSASNKELALSHFLGSISQGDTALMKKLLNQKTKKPLKEQTRNSPPPNQDLLF